MFSKNLEFENSIPTSNQDPRYNTIHRHLQSQDYDNSYEAKLVGRVCVAIERSIFDIFCQMPFLPSNPCNPNRDYSYQ